MIPVIFLALVLVPIAEIAVFIKVGGLIGVAPTIGLVVAVAIFGTWLLRRQGLQTFTRAQAALNRGEMPVGDMLDGLLLFLAALLMVTPGLLTDALGFALLVPAMRRALSPLLMRWAMARAAAGTVFYSDIRKTPGGPIIEGEAFAVDERRDGEKPGPRSLDEGRARKDS